MKRSRLLHLIIAVGIVALDRATKIAVAKRIALHDRMAVIPSFFSLTHVENRGAAFSLFADSHSRWTGGMLIGFSVVALLIVSGLLWKNQEAWSPSGIGLSLILGGAVGNLWDRVLNGRVVDFLLFYIRQYEWPAFNVADSAIVVGASLLVWEILFSKTEKSERHAPG